MSILKEGFGGAVQQDSWDPAVGIEEVILAFPFDDDGRSPSLNF